MLQPLNVCTQTPFGTLRPYGDPQGGQSIHNALNWALKYQHEETPANRTTTTYTDGGGPLGAFVPFIPKTDAGLAWLCTGQIFVPNRKSPYLLGEGYINGEPASTSAGHSAIRFSLSGESTCIINQANGLVMKGLTFYNGANDTLMVNTRVTSTGHPNYVANNSEGFGTGSTNTSEIQSRLYMTECGIVGFNVGIQNGATTGEANCDHHTLERVFFRDCGTGWKNVNDQGVNITFRDCLDSQCDEFARFDAGGHCIIDHITQTKSGGKTLVLGTGGAGGRGPGLNNGYFAILHPKTDTQATDGGWLVYMEDDSELDRNLTVVIDGGMNSRRVNSGSTLQQNRFARMVGRSRLLITSHCFPGQIECVGGDPGGSYPGSSWAPSITFIGCAFGLSAETADPKTLCTGTYNAVQVAGCVSAQASTSVAQSTPRAVPDIPQPTNTIPAGAMLVSTGNGMSTTPTPKAGQARELTYDITGAAASAGKVAADVTQVQVLMQSRYAGSAVYDKNSTDDSSSVSLADSDGVVTVTIQAADFGAGLLNAGVRYYVVIVLTLAGITGTVEVDDIQRLIFAEDQD